METYYKSQITLAGNKQGLEVTLCHSWLEFKFEQSGNLEIRFNCSVFFLFGGGGVGGKSIMKHLM